MSHGTTRQLKLLNIMTLLKLCHLSDDAPLIMKDLIKDEVAIEIKLIRDLIEVVSRLTSSVATEMHIISILEDAI